MFELVLNQTTGDRKPQSSITWYLDEERISSSSVVLTTGYHLIEAHFTTQNGTSKVVELELSVQ